MKFLLQICILVCGISLFGIPALNLEQVFPRMAFREPGGVGHYYDGKDVLGNGKFVTDVFEFVSKSMDTSAKNDFRLLFPEAKRGLGKDHRVTGHALDLGKSRKERIKIIKEKCSVLPEKEIERRLKAYDKKMLECLVEEVDGKWHIGKRRSKALVRLCFDIHVLADASTSRTREIPTVKRIITDIVRNLKVLVGDERASVIANRLRKFVVRNKGVGEKELCKGLMRILANLVPKREIEHLRGNVVKGTQTLWEGHKAKSFVPEVGQRKVYPLMRYGRVRQRSRILHARMKKRIRVGSLLGMVCKHSNAINMLLIAYDVCAFAVKEIESAVKESERQKGSVAVLKGRLQSLQDNETLMDESIDLMLDREEEFYNQQGE